MKSPGKYKLFIFLLLLQFNCYTQTDTLVTERFVQKNITYQFKGETYTLASKSFGNFIVHEGRRFYTYDTLNEFTLNKGDKIKFVAVTPQNKIAMQGTFKVVYVGRMRTMRKAGKWKYYDQFGKLILTRKEKIKETKGRLK